MFQLRINKNEFYCKSAEDIYSLIKQFVDKNFWDDVINDEVGEDINIIDCCYKPADVLKTIDKKYYNELCLKYWDECKKDVLDEINNIGYNQVVTIYGFEVTRIENV